MHLEARLEVEDGPAVLDGDDATGGERSAVADPVDLVEDRHGGVAGAEEVGVQRVDRRARAPRCEPPPPAPGRPPGRRRLAGDPRRGRGRGTGSPRSARGPSAPRARRLPPGTWRQSWPTQCPVRSRPMSATAARPSPTGSPGAPPPPLTRSKAGTRTTTGGRGSTTPARAARSRAAMRATAGTGGPRTSPSSESSASTTTGSRSSGVASSRPTASSPRWRSTTTCDSCEGLLEAGIDPVVTFHHFTTPTLAGRARGVVEPRDRRSLRRVLRARRPHGSSGVMRRACTINEPNIVSHHRVPRRRVPARPAGRGRCVARSTTCSSMPIARPSTPSGPPRPVVPVGLTLSMSDYQAVDGGESKLEQIRRGMEDVFLDATGGRRLRRRADLLAQPRRARRGWWAAEDGVPTLIMGYEYYPQALEATIRRAWERTGGEVPIVVTENGIGTDDDEQRMAYVRVGSEGVLCLPGRRDRRARLHVLEPAGQLRVGLRLRAPLRDRRLRSHHLRPHPQGERALARDGWRRPTLSSTEPATHLRFIGSRRTPYPPMQ